MIGLEHYIGMEESLPSAVLGEYYTETEFSSSESSEGLPQVQLIESMPKPKPSKAPNDLMMLLSGKQTAKKSSRKAKENPPVRENTTEYDLNSSLIYESVNADTSFEAGLEKSIQSTIRADQITALEQRIYSSAQLVSAFDLLQRHSNLSTEAETTVIDDLPNTTAELENKFTNGRTVNAKNIFLSFAPQKSKNKNGKWTLKVRLQISPSKLAALKPRNTPLISIASTPEYKVKLKVPVSALRDIQRTLNPLFTPKSGSQKGKNAKNVFEMMMKRATQNAMPKLTDLQKLHGLEPPPIKKGHMHVVSCHNDIPSLQTKSSSHELNLPRRFPSPPLLTRDTLRNYREKGKIYLKDSVPAFSYSLTPIEDNSVGLLIASNAPLVFTSPAHKRIYDDFILKKPKCLNLLPWPQRFQPPNLDCLLISEESRRFLKTWINNSFDILQTQSTKTPRNIKKRERARRQKHKLDPMADFIVDDFDDDGYETEEDIFLPILIIEGEIGAGKTASIYAAMNDIGGYVHEINSGQQRSRKDIHSSLKEFCTTQIVHQNQEERAFQKGLVLFEDCDVLFEQDKTFWTVVLEVINYSRRPIVLTVRDSSLVPRSIWQIAYEQLSIQLLKMDQKASLSQYLWLCCLAYGCLVDLFVISYFTDKCCTSTGFDIRKALMKLQLLCAGRQAPDGFYTEIKFEQDPDDDLVCRDLQSLSRQLEAISVSDILKENTFSSFLQSSTPNELLDVYTIDHSHQLKQPTLPYELNVGDFLEQVTNAERQTPIQEGMEFNTIKSFVLSFISSRTKKLPRFLEEVYNYRAQTRSRATARGYEEPELQGLPDTSTCYSMLRHAFIQDLAPFARDWAHFQRSLTHLDSRKPLDSREESLLDFIGWRAFHSDVEEVLRTI